MPSRSTAGHGSWGTRSAPELWVVEPAQKAEGEKKRIKGSLVSVRRRGLGRVSHDWCLNRCSKLACGVMCCEHVWRGCESS